MYSVISHASRNITEDQGSSYVCISLASRIEEVKLKVEPKKIIIFIDSSAQPWNRLMITLMSSS